MAAHGIVSSSSAEANLVSATANLLTETDTADMTLVCGTKEWRLHSLILAMRSPFFMAALSNNMREKRNKEITIGELDPKVMQQVIDYMHGVPLKMESIYCLPSIIEAADRFLMEDMKKDVTDMAIRSITGENAVQFGKLAEENSMDQVLEACAEYIVDNEVEVKEELAPKFANTMVRLLQKAIKKKSKQMAGDRCYTCGFEIDLMEEFPFQCSGCGQYSVCTRSNCTFCKDCNELANSNYF